MLILETSEVADGVTPPEVHILPTRAAAQIVAKGAREAGNPAGIERRVIQADGVDFAVYLVIVRERVSPRRVDGLAVIAEVPETEESRAYTRKALENLRT